jgi:hypothetical protein
MLSVVLLSALELPLVFELSILIGNLIETCFVEFDVFLDEASVGDAANELFSGDKIVLTSDLSRFSELSSSLSELDDDLRSEN